MVQADAAVEPRDDCEVSGVTLRESTCAQPTLRPPLSNVAEDAAPSWQAFAKDIYLHLVLRLRSSALALGVADSKWGHQIHARFGKT